jgi:hypothetical protein
MLEDLGQALHAGSVASGMLEDLGQALCLRFRRDSLTHT